MSKLGYRKCFAICRSEHLQASEDERLYRRHYAELNWLIGQDKERAITAFRCAEYYHKILIENTKTAQPQA